MKYFIAYLINGKAKKYHEALTRELAIRYNIFPLHDRVSPHITIKTPFETDEAGVKEVERVLRSFAHHEEAVPVSFRGFGRFGFRTIYLDVEKTAASVALVRRAIQTLNDNIPFLPRVPHEGNKLHASVARFLTRKKFHRIWRDLKEVHPHFDAVLDNVAILKKDGRAWKVHTVIALRDTEEEAESRYLEREPALV